MIFASPYAVYGNDMHAPHPSFFVRFKMFGNPLLVDRTAHPPPVRPRPARRRYHGPSHLRRIVIPIRDGVFASLK